MGLAFAYDLEKWLMRLTQVLRRGSIVVIVHDKGCQIKIRNGMGHGRLTTAGAGKTHVDLWGVQGPAQHARIGVARP